MSTDQRGFALITVLWLIAALATLVALDVGVVRLGNQVSANRIALSRGRWAAEACLAIVQARWGQQRLADTASIDLGRGTRCSWSTEDPTARINVNRADGELLLAAGWNDALVRAVIERRKREPLQHVDQLAHLPGYDPAVIELATVFGPGSINLSAAPRSIIRALPGMTPEAIDQILYRRIVGRPITSLDELAASLSPPNRALLLSRYADLARLATFAPPELVVRLEGWVVGFAPRATIEVFAVPLPERLAIVGRRMW
jgi:hypothetical protein